MARRKSQVLSAISPECPNCGTEFGTAFIQQLARDQFAQMRSELEQQLRAEASAAAAAELAAMRSQLAQADTQYQAALSESRAEAEAARRERDEARRAEQEVRQERRQLRQERDALEIEKDRMRDVIAEEERKKANQHAEERIRREADRNENKYLKRIHALEEQKRLLTEELASAHRKASAGALVQQESVSYQYVLADELRRRFPSDDITVVARGRRGGDVVHVVRESNLDCGTIVWECKQTQRFEQKWVQKLAEDVAAGRADLGVLVSAVLPRDVEGTGLVDGILVCDTTVAVPLALSFRQIVINAKRTAIANAARGDQADRIYDYITTGPFGVRLARILKKLYTQLKELNAVRETNTRYFAAVEKGHRDAIDEVFTLIGDLDATGVKLPDLLRDELLSPPPRSIESSPTAQKRFA
ncbi:DUF2130 domain-containing protein [Nocardia cyriacigeorgica]|uniref:DUF2130 domain-containing protein n=1 Tax=Nocardia cyriacigeorgica TaxID=135487 RepID=UPI0018952A38|nr:DUF2130 domain-containing protein [Nocardia cyriacigeorgica]MBF6320370.1 DUF2130 domain-containing protein [Nocardia cyriacigeorgica]MBF6534144.1 DUF2130 domain-containing protein [Nocardia cyriacigeorgica]